MGEDVNTMMHDALERQRFEQAVASLCLLDDPFMTVVFQDNLACVDLVIQIVLNNPNLHATRVITQDTIQNLHGHSVRLDIHALADGQEFNIEIQRAAGGAARRRAAGDLCNLYYRDRCTAGRAADLPHPAQN